MYLALFSWNINEEVIKSMVEKKEDYYIESDRYKRYLDGLMM